MMTTTTTTPAKTSTNQAQPQPPPPQQSAKNGPKINRLMNTPNFLKTKFMSVLGSSNELINEISNRLDISLSQSSPSEQSFPRDPRLSICVNNDDDDSMDENVIDFESRKVKEQRARDELKSGCYRQPNFNKHGAAAAAATADVSSNLKHDAPMRFEHLSVPTTATQQSLSSSPSSVANVEPRALAQSESAGSTTATSPMREIFDRGGFTAASFDITSISSHETKSLASAMPASKPSLKSANVSSTTSENDPSECSSAPNRYARTVSANSVTSLGSSLSLDSRTDESPQMIFMRDFVDILFVDSSAITLDMKSEFGSKSRSEIGRLSFARLVSAKRSVYKKVTEAIFYSLIQYFAIVLFECCDSEDYSPAKILMNMCFTFYHEVDVPGCEPYREYLYTYLREQPIWQSLRFWNAAIFDALQCERIRSILPTVYITHASHRKPVSNKSSSEEDGRVPIGNNHQQQTPTDLKDDRAKDDSGDDVSSSGQSGGADDENEEDGSDDAGEECAAHVDLGLVLKRTRLRSFDRPRQPDRRAEEAKMHQNISFGQLGTFTCNMHAFGLPRTLCTEFLRKQCVIANLNQDQEKALLDNVNRMYNETAKWRT